MDPNSLDLELLRKELHRAIGELRKEKDLKSLQQDPILRQAAEEQAAYVKDRGRLTHRQDNARLRTPYKRVIREGGRHRPVGENLLRVYVERGMSYRALADSMASIWKHSPPHYANIKEEAFKRSGIAFSYDKEEQSLYAAQVFGGDPPSFDLQELPEPTSYQRFLSGLFPPCGAFDRKEGGGGISFANGHILVDDYRRGKRLFREEHPLYVRYKNFEFDCQSGLVEEEQKSYRLKERRKMIRDAKRYSDKDLPSVKLFGEQRFLDLFRSPDKMEADLALPREPFGKDSVYRTTLYFTHRGFVCKKIEMLDLRLRFDETMPYPELPFDTASVRYPSLVERSVHRDTVGVQLRFARNQERLPLDRAKAEMEKLKARQKDLHHFEVVVNASVEGSREENEALLKSRKEDLSRRLDSIFENGPSIRVRTKENWETFREDLEKRSLDSLAGLPKSELRDSVNARVEDPLIDSLLHRQRFLAIKAHLRRVERDSLDPSPINQKMVKRFNELLDGLRDTTKRDYEIASMLEEMSEIQKRLQKGHMLGHVKRSTLRRLRTGRFLRRMDHRTVQLGWILYRKALFRYKVLGELRVQELHRRLQRLARFKVLGRQGNEEKALLDMLDRDRIQRWVTVNALLSLRRSPLTASDPESFLLCFPKGDNSVRRSLCRGRKELDPGPERAMANIEAFAQWRGVNGVPDDTLEKLEIYANVQKLRLIYPMVEEHEQEVRKRLRTLDRYYTRGDRLSRDRRVRLAKFFYSFKHPDDALGVLGPLLEKGQAYPRAVGLALRIEWGRVKDQEEELELFREYRDRYRTQVFCESLKRYWQEGGDLRSLRGGKVREMLCNSCSMHLD